jgi:Bacterial regulatory protein, Fis family
VELDRSCAVVSIHRFQCHLIFRGRNGLLLSSLLDGSLRGGRGESALGSRPHVCTRLLYDHLGDLPAWFRKLAPAQLQEIASVMIRWQLPNQSHCITALDEFERREALRAVALCNGNIADAAKALKIGKTTLYEKLSRWDIRFTIEVARASLRLRRTIQKIELSNSGID